MTRKFALAVNHRFAARVNWRFAAQRTAKPAAKRSARRSRAYPRSPEEILREAGVDFVVHEHVPVTSVAEIVEALPFPAEEHVKTLAVDADGRTALVALRGSDRLHFGRLSRALGVPRDRVSPLPPDRVRTELGLEPGGVCLLVDEDVVRIVDRSVLDLGRVYTGSGRSDRTLELAAAGLVAVSGASVAVISQ